MKDIRNAFAHTLEVSDFSSQKIESWTANLKLCERYATDMKAPRKPKDPKVDYSKIPHREWESWIFVHDLKEVLQNPRDRFLISIQMFNWAFSIPHHTAMPQPIF